MPYIQHIAELFIYDEREFITAAYRLLLERDPDPAGMNYYLGRLHMGHGKAAIIVQLATSAEANPRKKINGLSNLIKDEKRANHWFWGIFTRQQRSERLIHKHTAELSRVIDGTIELKTAIQALPTAIDTHAQHIHASLLQFMRHDRTTTAFSPRHAASEELIAPHVITKSQSILSQTIDLKEGAANEVIDQLAELLTKSQEAQQLLLHLKHKEHA